jgi:hypothetical protein
MGILDLSCTATVALALLGTSRRRQTYIWEAWRGLGSSFRTGASAPMVLFPCLECSTMKCCRVRFKLLRLIVCFSAGRRLWYDLPQVGLHHSGKHSCGRSNTILFLFLIENGWLHFSDIFLCHIKRDLIGYLRSQPILCHVVAIPCWYTHSRGI